MGSRGSSRRRLLRDIAQSFVVFGWAVAMAGVLIYFVDWSAVRREAAARPPSHSGKSDDLLYTGAIFVPTRGALCWEGMFDNRTGRMTDKGFVNCGNGTSHRAGNDPPQGMDAVRLRTIGKAFHRDGD
jgi:hypothetical protein